jgi:hypothetical protein
MKTRFLVLVTPLVLIWGCNDDSPSTPQNHNPIPTAPGTPDGAPTAATIGPDGGELASSDARFTIEIPAGALSADTEIGIQPITNTAWGGLGEGYRLTPDGLTFAVPVSLVFTVPESISASVPFVFLDAAVQDDAGYWYVLKNKSSDEAGGTLTATTTHFSNYSMIAGVQIAPSAATVQTGKTLPLSISVCTFEAVTVDQDILAALVASCDDELAPLGAFTNWSVNGVRGGGLADGIVAENGGPLHAIYTAPPVVPSNNPVAVSVATNFGGHQALLVSNVTVSDNGGWTGTSVLDYGNGITVTSTITWTYSETNGSLVEYTPSGVVTYHQPNEGDCAVTSITPSQHPIASGDGFLSIDVSANPGLYLTSGATVWPATVCIQCSYDTTPRCSDTYIGGQWAASSGEVSQDGRTISGVLDLGGGATLTYTFTKQP